MKTSIYSTLEERMAIQKKNNAEQAGLNLIQGLKRSAFDKEEEFNQQQAQQMANLYSMALTGRPSQLEIADDEEKGIKKRTAYEPDKEKSEIKKRYISNTKNEQPPTLTIKTVEEPSKETVNIPKRRRKKGTTDEVINPEKTPTRKKRSPKKETTIKAEAKKTEKDINERGIKAISGNGMKKNKLM